MTLKLVPPTKSSRLIVHEHRGSLVLRAWANGAIEVYFGVEVDGPKGDLCYDTAISLTEDEATHLHGALGGFSWQLREYKRHASGEAAYRVTMKDSVLSVTHDKETFPIRRSTFRPGKRHGLWTRSCAACKATSLRAGYVLVHEAWKGPRWQDAVICDGCVERQLEERPRLRSVK